MNRDLFIVKGKINRTIFVPSKPLCKDDESDLFKDYGNYTIFIFVKMDYKKSDLEYLNEKLLMFDYNTAGKFLFISALTINGKSILGELGFYSKKHDKYDYTVIDIKDDIFSKLKSHLQELEK